MTQRDDDKSEPTWPEIVQQFSTPGDPVLRRIRAAHEEGDYETRDRLWRYVEGWRSEHGVH